jgi:hypothetical protein
MLNIEETDAEKSINQAIWELTGCGMSGGFRKEEVSLENMMTLTKQLSDYRKEIIRLRALVPNV